MQASNNLSGLAKRLVSDGVFTAETAQQALLKARAEQRSFIYYLITNRIISARRAASAASEEFGLSLLDLDAIPLEVIAKDVVDSKVIVRHHALPLMK